MKGSIIVYGTGVLVVPNCFVCLRRVLWMRSTEVVKRMMTLRDSSPGGARAQCKAWSSNISMRLESRAERGALGVHGGGAGK